MEVTRSRRVDLPPRCRGHTWTGFGLSKKEKHPRVVPRGSASRSGQLIVRIEPSIGGQPERGGAGTYEVELLVTLDEHSPAKFMCRIDFVTSDDADFAENRLTARRA